MHDDVDIKCFSNHLHCLQIVGRYGDNKDTVLLIVCSLDLCQVRFDLFALLEGHIGQIDGALNAETTLPNPQKGTPCSSFVLFSQSPKDIEKNIFNQLFGDVDEKHYICTRNRQR